MHIRENKTVIKIGDPKLFILVYLKMLTKLLKHEIDLIIKQNEFLAEHTIKNKIN